MKQVIKEYENVFGPTTIGAFYDGGDFEFQIKISVHYGETPSIGSHFKIYDGPIPVKSTKLARIEFAKPEYLIHSDALPMWYLNNSEKKNLIKFFNEYSEETPEPTTNWDYAKYQWNKELGFLVGMEYETQFRTPLEAYLNNYYDTPENLEDNQYLSSELKMPNYMEL